MGNSILKTILTAGVLLILFIIAVKVLRFAIAVLLPVAIIIVAAYIVYMFIKRR